MQITIIFVCFLAALILLEKQVLDFTLLVDVHWISFYLIIENMLMNPKSGRVQRFTGDYLRCMAVTAVKMMTKGDFQAWKLFLKTPSILICMALVYSLKVDGVKKYYYNNTWLRTLVQLQFQLVKAHMYIATLPMLYKLYPYNPIIVCLLVDLSEGLAVRSEYILEKVVTEASISNEVTKGVVKSLTGKSPNNMNFSEDFLTRL